MAVFVKSEGQAVREGGEKKALQTEFPLAVAVCAWCKPRRGAARLGGFSHGICLRHLREMKLEVQGFCPGVSRSAPRRREGERVVIAEVMTLPL